MAIDKTKRQNLTLGFLFTGPKTFNEITGFYKKIWELLGYEFVISQRTFQRDIQDIQDKYGITIAFDKSADWYRIPDGEAYKKKTLIDSLVLNEIRQLSGRVKEFVFNEDRHVSGAMYIVDVLAAIKSKKVLKVEHKKFGKEPTIRMLEPYGVKEFRYRWYLIARDLGDRKIKSFGLERVLKMTQLDRMYKIPRKFDMEKYYANSYGVMGGELKPEEVEIAFNPSQKGYLNTLPFQDNQEVLVDDDREFRIKLQIAITKDFVMDLLERTPDFKVIKPQSLIDKIKSYYLEALSKYD